MLKAVSFFLFLFFPSFLFAQNTAPITLKGHQDLLLVGKEVEFLEDMEGKMKLEDILLPQTQPKFRPHTQTIFTRPATTSVFWFKINFQNYCSEDAWLEVGTAFAWYLDFYRPDSANFYRKYETGIFQPKKNRFYDITNAFWFPLNPAHDTQTRTYYLRLSTEFPPEMPLQIGTLRALQKNKDKNDFFSAGFVGLMAIMILYNTFLYFSTQDRIYLFYLPYLMCVLVNMPFLGGYSFFEGAWAYQYYMLWGNLPNIFGILFCINYLQLQKHAPSFRKILFTFLLLLTFLSFLPVLGLRMVYLITFYQILIVSSALTSLLAGYYLAWKHKKKAVFYILGWNFALGSIIIFIAVINGFLPFNTFTRNILYFGTGLEVGMFSLALGYRVNILKALNLRLIKNQNAVLEQKVEARTQELKTTLGTLARQRDEIVTSIHYALRIQHAIMPTENDLKKHFDCFVFFRPKNIVSGDFYWFAEKVISGQGQVISEQPSLLTNDHLPLSTKKYILAVADC